MKSASSKLIVRLIAGVFVILVFLLQTLAVAEGILTTALNDNKEELNIESEDENKIIMPTADVLTNDRYRSEVAGTDKWNENILKISLEENIDPIFVKCIMALESGGELDLVCYNGNSTYDSGLMQVNSSWGKYYDLERLTYDADYAIRCGIEVIKAKIQAAELAGHEPTVYEVAWRYNGYCQAGLKYADKFISLYQDLSKNTENLSIVLNNNDESSNVLLEK